MRTVFSRNGFRYTTDQVMQMLRWNRGVTASRDRDDNDAKQPGSKIISLNRQGFQKHGTQVRNSKSFPTDLQSRYGGRTRTSYTNHKWL